MNAMKVASVRTVVRKNAGSDWKDKASMTNQKVIP